MIYDQHGALIKTVLASGRKPDQITETGDLYRFDSCSVWVATDRITVDGSPVGGIPGKGKLSMRFCRFWLERFPKIRHCCRSFAGTDLPESMQASAEELAERVMILAPAPAFPVNAVVRGRLSGSAWNDYQHTGAVFGMEVKCGLRLGSRLHTPLFTPLICLPDGQERYVPYAEAVASLGAVMAAKIRRLALDVFQTADTHARKKSLILADARLRFITENGELKLTGEILSPDTSRFWRTTIADGENSSVKTALCQWLQRVGWTAGDAPPPELPADVLDETWKAYRNILDCLAGEE